MKTKIIYISGNEVFEMSEIRAAFDSVRAALGLDNDTILFGVPVDADNALSNIDTTPATNVAPVVEPIIETVAEPENEPVVESVVAPIAESIAEPTVEPVVDIVPETSETPEAEPVIPILSILSAQETPTDPVIEPVPEPVAEPIVETIAEPVESAIISDINVDAELSAPVGAVDDAIETVTIGDMITDDTPVPQMEKTLEELLETMAPLREDVQPEPAPEITADIFDGDDMDATLAQLATEFADTQDKIPSTPRASATGKIGKLKNILPFKKAKRDDNGLMGDLFGWAGIAANDEDFSIPGFFTPATSKKQGA
jgi:hypothetical protein